jgi:hypothetical protein
LIAVRDDFRPLYRTMLVLGGAAIVILSAGFLFLLAVAPPSEHTGLRATIEGVYLYDPSDATIHGGPRRSFAPDQSFAAKVDWSLLPPTTVVGAQWYNGLAQVVGRVGPSAAGQLAAEGALVVLATPQDGRQNLPGVYTVVVARYSHGQAVELLARTSVLVERSG